MSTEKKKISKRKIVTIMNSVFSAIIVAVSALALTKTFTEFGPLLDNKKSEKSSIKVYEEEFFTTTNNLIDRKDSLSISIETVKKIFNSIDRKSNGKLFNYGFINVLEDYSVNLITNPEHKESKNFDLIIELINEELKGEPYNQLKPEQKRILLNLQNAIKTNDIKNGTYNLNELNDVMRIQNENVEKLEKQNSWSIPLAIIGIILTLIFGIISLIKSLKSVKSSENNNS